MLKRNWALIWFVYFALAEILSLAPVPDLSLCLMQPEHGEQSTNHDDRKYCAPFHVGAALAFEKTDRWLEAHDKSVIGAFTIVLAISTIGLWLATNKLWRSADATAEAQERDTRILQRAYLSVEPLGLSLLIDNAHLLGLVGFKNAGNLPARNLSWAIKMIASTNGELESFPSHDTKGNIVVAPNSETTRGSDGRLVLSDLLTMASAGNGRMNETPIFIYVYGVVRYHDGFADGRLTRFCHRYNYKVRPQVPGTAGYSMSRDLARQHTYGNEST